MSSLLAEVKAAAILRDCGLKDAPISLDTVCRHLNIRSRRFVRDDELNFLAEHNVDQDDINMAEGFAFRAENGERIIKVVADYENIPHMRTIAAHEIGHHSLNHLGLNEVLLSTGVDAQRNSRDKREQQADDFARHLLVPMHLLKQYVTEFGVCGRNDLAAIFEVEPFVVEHQLDEWHASESIDYRNYINTLKSIA